MADVPAKEAEKRELEVAPENVVGGASEDDEIAADNSESDELDVGGEEVADENTEMDGADVDEGATPDVLFDRNAVNAQLPPHVEELSPEQPMLQVASSMGVPSPFSKDAPPSMQQ